MSVLISYMKMSNLESLISIKMSKMEHSNSMSTFLLWVSGRGPKVNYYNARMGSPWGLEFTLVCPLQSQGKHVNNMHLLLTEASNSNSNSIWFSLLL